MSKLSLLLIVCGISIGILVFKFTLPSKTGGWNLYKTDGWEFYYPRGWQIKYQNLYGKGSGFEIGDSNEIYTLTFMEYANTPLSELVGQPEKFRKTTVAGQEAIVTYDTTAFWKSPDGKHIHVLSVIQNKPKSWLKFQNKKLLQDILSSFRYLNTSSKILFNLSDGFAFGQSWPDELKQLKDEDLLDLKCSEASFETRSDGINFSYWCDAPNQSRILVEEVHGDSYLDVNISRIGNTFSGLVNIPNPGWSYFTCANPLALTNDGVFYVQCGGGQEGFAGSVIYKIHLGMQQVIKVLQCTSRNPAGWSMPKIECN
jgi:hypothetical protein